MKSNTLSILSISLLLSNFSAAVSLDCSHIRVDDTKFDLSKIGGPHSVLVRDESKPPAILNTTWTIDICAPLKKVKDIPTGDQCPTGTYVCGITKSWNPIDDPDQEHVQLDHVIPVAGSFATSTGKALDPKVTRLKASDSKANGLLLELNGGSYGNMKQRAVVEFQCDESRTGNEESESTGNMTKRAETENPEDGPSLTYLSYDIVEGKEKIQVLRLNWRTKYACEDYEDDEPETKKGGWGFFTWFILLAFLGAAAYLIFGSWLNYNRYGARGWDLLPHGDTIRDIPYLVKDWSRKVVETVSGTGSRGGYSAV